MLLTIVVGMDRRCQDIVEWRTCCLLSTASHHSTADRCFCSSLQCLHLIESLLSRSMRCSEALSLFLSLCFFCSPLSSLRISLALKVLSWFFCSLKHAPGSSSLMQYHTVSMQYTLMQNSFKLSESHRVRERERRRSFRSRFTFSHSLSLSLSLSLLTITHIIIMETRRRHLSNLFLISDPAYTFPSVTVHFMSDTWYGILRLAEGEENEKERGRGRETGKRKRSHFIVSKLQRRIKCVFLSLQLVSLSFSTPSHSTCFQSVSIWLISSLSLPKKKTCSLCSFSWYRSSSHHHYFRVSTSSIHTLNQYSAVFIIRIVSISHHLVE